MTKKAVWLCAVVGLIWIGIGLRDMFAPHFFNISPNVPETSRIILDFAAGVAFLACAFSLHKSQPSAR